MRPVVTVVVVNYDSGRHLRACLDSVADDLRGVEWSGVVVDNASPTDGVGTIENWLTDRLTILRNDSNRGFGAAVNQAVRASQPAALLWLLNPDCRVLSRTFAMLSAELEAHPECAVVAPQLLNADGTIQESARGEPSAWTGLFGRHGLLTRLLPNSKLARKNLRARDLAQSGEASVEIDWAMGASLLIRRDVFDEVGGFDERFFLYWEDADLCRRIRTRGHSVRYVPGARVMHLGGESSRRARRLATRAFHRSAYLYYTTHVATSPRSPARLFAWTALNVRAWWRVLRG